MMMLAALWFLTKHNTEFTNAVYQQIPEYVAKTYPLRMQDEDFNNQMFGRTALDVRNPFGPNSQQKTIQEMKFFDNRKYQKQYQSNLHEMLIENQDWRLDYTMSSHINNYAQPHQPENNVMKMKSFANHGLEYKTDYDNNAILI